MEPDHAREASSQSLTENQAERLSLVRYQLLLASEQARLPAPLNVLALSSAHDALETILHVAATFTLVEVKSKWTFDDLFLAVASASADPSKLRRHRVAIQALNEARVGYKHHGNRADATSLKAHVETAHSFAHDTTSIIFGRDLAEIDMITFIKYGPSRAQLHEAERAASSGDYEQAMCQLRLAFDGIVHDYTSRKREYVGRSLFTSKPSFMPTRRRLEQHGLEKIIEWLESIDSYTRYLAIGIDMRRLAYLEANSPSVFYSAGGGHRFILTPGMAFDEEMYRRCYRFVLDTGLSFVPDDFDFDSHERRIRAIGDASMDGDAST